MSGSGSGSGGSGGNKTVFRPSPLQGLRQGQGQGGAQPPAPPQQGWGGPPPPAPGGGWGGGYAPPPSPQGYAPTPPPGGYAPPPPPPAYSPPPPPIPETQGYDALPTLSRTGHGPAAPALAPSRLADDDVPLPATPRQVRNIMLSEAQPVLALAAGIRSGRVQTGMPQFHREAVAAITNFDRAVAPHYPEETRQRAKYALCSTIDDIAQNLPGLGTDGAEWARRALVVHFFQENIGGDRFWQLVDDMLRTPNDNLDLIELYHACLAAGFEGRFRVMPDGRRRLHEIMARLHGALPHVRSLSMVEMSPMWKGETAPVGKLGFWSIIALAAAGTLALLVVIYILLRVILGSTGGAPWDRLAAINPSDRLTLSRSAPPPPAAAGGPQAAKLKKFLEPEIKEGLVTVEEDAQTVRVRTTVGQLFQSASDQLDDGRRPLFERIGAAIESEPGTVTVEGHTDADRIASAQFPDNMALAEARAKTVADIIRAKLSDGSRVVAKGFGDSVPIGDNKTPEGKSRNRRVEVVVPRQY